MDEVSIRKGHSYAITVADLDRQRPIWMSESPGRAEEDMARFFNDMGPKRAARIKLAVMDMWKPFRNATRAHAPQTRIVFDKFHVLMEGLNNKIRAIQRRAFGIKDQRYLKLNPESPVGSRDSTANPGLLPSQKSLFVVPVTALARNAAGERPTACTFLFVKKPVFSVSVLASNGGIRVKT